MGALYLPLRSNAAWFANEDSHAALERRVKNLLVVYDKLIVQDGRYEVTAWQDGVSMMESMVPPDQLADSERRRIRYSQRGQPSSIAVAAGASRNLVPILGGPISFSHCADFHPLFESAGIRTESYIEWWDADLRGEGWRQAVNRSSRDAEHEGFAEILPECSRTERKKLLEVLYVDATTAAALHVPFSSDPVVRRFAEWGIRHALAPFGPDPRLAVYQRWVSICIPDFSVASWAEIHDLRESAAGKDLRATLQRVADRVAIELPNLQTEADVDDLLAREYVREVTEAAVPRTPAAARAARAIAIDLGLNWLGIPPLGSTALAAASEVFGILRERRQWISLLDWEPSARRSRPLRIGLREP